MSSSSTSRTISCAHRTSPDVFENGDLGQIETEAIDVERKGTHIRPIGGFVQRHVADESTGPLAEGTAFMQREEPLAALQKARLTGNQLRRDGSLLRSRPHKAFKAYEPGDLHMGVKYLPQMQDEKCRRYLLVAIDQPRAGCSS